MTHFVDNDSFPKVGVHLSLIDQFISDHGGVNNFQCYCEENPTKLRSLTTSEVVEKFIKPETEGEKSSYCEHLMRQGHADFVGEPNVFISHGWGDSFLELKDRLSSLNLPENRPRGVQGDIIIWLDIFTNNQHTTTKKPSEWWRTTFYTAVKDIHCTVFMLTPNAVTRAWCIWELFATIDSGSHFQIATSQALSEKTRSFLFGSTIAIDSAKSKCRDPEDEKRLAEAIGLTGFDKIDHLISQKANEEVQRLRGLVKENLKEALQVIPQQQVVGIAIDFSESMKHPFNSLQRDAQKKLKEEENFLSRIETVINALLERLKDTNMQGKKGLFFACAFGLRGRERIGDLFHMIRYTVSAFKISRDLLLAQSGGSDPEPEACWERLIQLLVEKAPYVREYAHKNRKHFSPDLIKFLLPILQDDPVLRQRLIDRLPDCCKSHITNAAVQAASSASGLPGAALALPLLFTPVGPLLFGVAVVAAGVGGSIASKQVNKQIDTQSEQAAKEIVEQTIKDVNDNYLQPRLLAQYGDIIQPLNKMSFVTHENLQQLLNDWKILKISEHHSLLGEFDLFSDRFYGDTPLYQTFSKTCEMFRGFEREEIGKVLLTISDGESTGETNGHVAQGNLAIRELHQMNVRLVNCFISTGSLVGKRLLSRRPVEWRLGPSLLFDISSEVKKNHPALQKLQAKGWDISELEEKFRLFFHANTSEIIDTFFDVAMEITEKDSRTS